MVDAPPPTGASKAATGSVGRVSPVLQCIGLHKRYGSGATAITVLRSVDISIAVGERVAIVGRSGAGKSTLLNLLGGLDLPSAGQVLVCGEDMTTLDSAGRGGLRNRRLGFVYQLHHLLREFTALENVAMPLLISDVPAAEASARAADMLSRVGLSARLGHKPAQLSVGERQRAAVARALVAHPDCVLLDEPTGSLDTESADAVQALMMDLSERLRIAFVVVTHHVEFGASMDRVLRLDDGVLSACSAQ